MSFPQTRLGDLQNDFALTVASIRSRDIRRRDPVQFRKEIRWARAFARRIRKLGGLLPKRPRWVSDADAWGRFRLAVDLPIDHKN